MYDSFGDGWNGASLSINVGGETNTYTVGFDDNNGDFNIVTFTVTDASIITLEYAPGTFESEVTYFLYDSDGNLVFSDGPNPEVGVVFSGTIACPSCPQVPAGSVSIEDIRAFSADVSWMPSDPEGTYLLEYGLDGFTPGDGTVISVEGFSATLTGLFENTAYEAYLTVACANGDTSGTVGPYPFTTRYANDVGIVNISSPLSGCGLGQEAVSVIMQNFGGLPQSLIPFNYSVNGVPAGVPQPLDGFYTGVLGIDSLETIEFETTYDFTEPGTYVIEAWTELDEDSVLPNDTTVLVVNSTPIIAEFPYFEDFETWGGGWYVTNESENPSWEYGEPDGTQISAAAGGNGAWVTNLSGTYNNGEMSYLISPCLDFSGLAEDPVFSFSLNLDLESFGDEAWVEVSTNGGETWSKLGTSDSGINWYNDGFNDWWDGSGGFDGWVHASHPLEGTADSADVRIRFVLSTDFSDPFEGIGLDNVLIHLPVASDLAMSQIASLSSDACGVAGEQIIVSLTNLGADTISGFDLIYQIDQQPPVLENVGDFAVLPGETAEYAFQTLFPVPGLGEFEIQAWLDYAEDGLVLNDSLNTTLEITVLNEIPFVAEFPYYEDFESGRGGWIVDSESENSSWEFGQPQGSLISAAAAGLNAWVTNLSGNYNNAEESYLLSPCYDFSGFTQDPVLTFSLFFESESCCDEGWVEVSTDGGETWAKLGEAGTGLNWYDDASNDWWDGDGGFSGWVYASHPLGGTAGAENVRIRFALDTDFSVIREGMGIDNVLIHLPFADDLTASGVSNVAGDACGALDDQVTITITNLGTQPISGFDVAYQVNDGPVVTENVGPLEVLPGESEDYTFTAPFNSTGGGTFEVTTWTAFPDEFALNDTTSTMLAMFQALPLVEDFESGVFPGGWTTPEFNPIYGPGAHNTPDFNLGDNMYVGDQSFEFTTEVYGPVEPGYTVTFDYRYTDWSAGTTPAVLSPQDSLQLFVSTDCGETFTPIVTVTGADHLPSATYTNVGVLLDDYVGQPVQFRLFAVWGTGDYWLDVDNFNVQSCPSDFGFQTNVTNESASGAADGSIFIGGMPVGGFSFQWENGLTTPFRSGLTAGTYTVTITNPIGCSIVQEFEVDMVSSLDGIEQLQALSLAPNPTSGFSRLRVDFTEAVDARIEVLNLMGQVLLADRQRSVTRAEYDIDLQRHPAGLYLVRLQVDGQMHTEKLILSK